MQFTKKSTSILTFYTYKRKTWKGKMIKNMFIRSKKSDIYLVNMEPGPPGWGLGMGLTIPPHKKLPVKKPEM
jgi:hypothetical protein